MRMCCSQRHTWQRCKGSTVNPTAANYSSLLGCFGSYAPGDRVPVCLAPLPTAVCLRAPIAGLNKSNPIGVPAGSSAGDPSDV